MQNNSGIHPKGRRVLIAPDIIEEKTRSGIIIAAQQLDKEQLAQILGLVVEVGAEAWNDNASQWAAPGDRVIFGKYSGLEFKGRDGIIYRVINDREIVATVEEGVSYV